MGIQDNNTAPVDVDAVSMSIIAYGGDARSYAGQAIFLAKSSQIEEAKKALEEGRKSAHQAHNEQLDLISAYANGSKVETSILLTHAMGHLMCAELAIEMAAEIVELYALLNQADKC